MKNKKLKQTNASAHLVRYRFKIREGSPKGTRETMEESICERYDWLARWHYWQRVGPTIGRLRVRGLLK